MRTLTKCMAGAALGAALLASAPASAQYYGDDYDRYRDRDRVEDVVRGIGTVVGAVAAATQGGYYGYGRPGYGSSYGYGNSYGNGRGLESHAVNACAYEAERRYGRYGGARVEVRDVNYSRNGRLRVLGAVDRGGIGGYGDYGRYGSYGRNDRGRIAFTCEVGRGGRVSRFSSHNYSW